MVVVPQQCEIQVYGYRTVGDPQCLWSFVVKDAVLSLSTEVEEGKVCVCARRGVCAYPPARGYGGALEAPP